jgi:hypothetical protein
MAELLARFVEPETLRGDRSFQCGSYRTISLRSLGPL